MDKFMVKRMAMLVFILGMIVAIRYTVLARISPTKEIQIRLILYGACFGSVLLINAFWQLAQKKSSITEPESLPTTISIKQKDNSLLSYLKKTLTTSLLVGIGLNLIDVEGINSEKPLTNITLNFFFGHDVMGDYRVDTPNINFYFSPTKKMMR